MPVSLRNLGCSVALLMCAASASAQSVIDIGIPANDVRFNSQTGNLYLAVPSSAGPSYGNRLVEVSSVDGSILRSVFVGSEPLTIGMSPDSARAYVGLKGANLVVPVDLTAMTAGASFSPGNSQHDGPLFACRIAVLAGSPESVAISLCNRDFSPRFEGLAIYDDGVARQTVDHSVFGSTVIAFGSTPGLLYGYDNEDTSFTLGRYSVTSAGVSLVTSASDVISGFNAAIVTRGETLYSTSGQVVEGTTLSLLGSYTLPGSGYADAVVLDDSVGSAVFITDNGVSTFDRDTFIPEKSFDVFSNGFANNASTCGRPACVAVSYTGDDALIVQDVRDIFEGKFE